MYDYENLIKPSIVPVNLIKLSDEEFNILMEFVAKVVEKKQGEFHHKIDGGQEQKRWSTGIGGEMALEKFLGAKFVDLAIGFSNDFHVPDLTPIGVKAGVKSVEYGKFPIIFKNSSKPEIIITRKGERDFYICGLATIDALNAYQSDELVLSPSLRSRGTKTGFYGLDKLIQFKNLEELKRII